MTDYGSIVEVSEFSGADPTAQLFNAVDYVNSVGGGKVVLPRSPDPFYLERPFLPDDCIRNVALQGHGLGTVLMPSPGMLGWFSINGAINFALYDLKIDGNARSGCMGHGLRVGPLGAPGFTFERGAIVDSDDYGLGLQYGNFSGLRLRDLVIDGCGLDGIDFKNMDDDNLDLTVDNIHIRNFGRSMFIAPGDTTLSPCSGMDIRGYFQGSRINVYGVGGNNAKCGIRLRSGEAGEPAGYGGHFSMIDQFRIFGVHDPNDTTSVGLYNDGYCGSFSQGRIVGVNHGVDNNQTDNTYSQVAVQHCKTGWTFNDLTHKGLPTRGGNATLISCSARDCIGGNGAEVKTNGNEFSSWVGEGNSRSLHFYSSTGNRVIGGSSLGNDNPNKGAAVYRGHGGVPDQG